MRKMHATLQLFAFLLLFFRSTCVLHQKEFENGIKNEEIREKIQGLINAELKFGGLINWACYYNEKPSPGPAALNIEFDHIPPARFYDNEDQVRNAPTLAISRFDHYSEVWRQCTTGNPKFAGIFDEYKAHKSLKVEEKFTCAIYANLRCLRDKERELKKEDRIFQSEYQTAFKRYVDGFEKLVGLHEKKGWLSDMHVKILRDWMLNSLMGHWDSDEERTLWKQCCRTLTGPNDNLNTCLGYEFN